MTNAACIHTVPNTMRYLKQAFHCSNPIIMMNYSSMSWFIENFDPSFYFINIFTISNNYFAQTVTLQHIVDCYAFPSYITFLTTLLTIDLQYLGK